MSNIVRVDKLRSTAFGSITTSYTTLGLVFTHAMRILHFVNTTNGDILISFDGTNDNLFIPAGGFILYDFTSDEDSTERFRFQNDTQVYVKYSTAPSSGAVYLMCTYGLGE